MMNLWCPLEFNCAGSVICAGTGSEIFIAVVLLCCCVVVVVSLLMLELCDAVGVKVERCERRGALRSSSALLRPSVFIISSVFLLVLLRTGSGDMLQRMMDGQTMLPAPGYASDRHRFS